jgi:hypothetical protein
VCKQISCWWQQSLTGEEWGRKWENLAKHLEPALQIDSACSRYPAVGNQQILLVEPGGGTISFR